MFINFVRQEPTTAYSASGTSLTLTSATSASDDMYCVYLGKAVQTVNPPNASVGLSQLTATGTKDATTFLRGDNTFASAGGANTPAFSVYLSANQSITNNTYTKLTFDSEEYDSGGVFASNKFTPAVVGKYIISAGASIDSDQNSNCDQARLAIYKNGSALRVVEPDFRANPIRRANPTFSYLINVTSVSDYFEIFAFHSAAISDVGVFVQGGASFTYFNGYKIIE